MDKIGKIEIGRSSIMNTDLRIYAAELKSTVDIGNGQKVNRTELIGLLYNKTIMTETEVKSLLTLGTYRNDKRVVVLGAEQIGYLFRQDITEPEMEKMMQVARHAMNIQALDAVFSACNSDDEPVKGTERPVIIVYNLENISTKEVEEKLNNGSYEFDTRIIRMYPEQFANLFPHRGEAKKGGGVSAYWRPLEYMKDYIHCECSNCGYSVEAIQAVTIGESSTDYTGVKWRYCPKCGFTMSNEPVYKIDTDKVCDVEAISRGGRSVVVDPDEKPEW